VLVALFRGDDLVAIFGENVARESIVKLLSDELLASPDLSLRRVENYCCPVLVSGPAFQEWIDEERLARG